MFRVGKINKSMTPGDLYRSISRLSETKYFCDKFGLSTNIINNVLESRDLDISTVKNNIKIIMHDTSSKTLNPGIIVASIIKSHPLHQAILKNMNLELHDLYDFIRYSNLKGTQILLDNQIEAIDKINQILSRKKHRLIFLVGEKGEGKTSLVKKLSGDNIYFDANIIEHDNRESAKKKIYRIFNEFKEKALVIDNAHRILEEGLGSIDLSAEIIEYTKSGKSLIAVVDADKFKNLKSRLPSDLKNSHQVTLSSPSHEDSLKLMLIASDKLEKYKKVIITYNALKSALELSGRSNEGIQNPQKAIDILEKTIIDVKKPIITAADLWDNLDSSSEEYVMNHSLKTYYLLGPIGAGKTKFTEDLAQSLDNYTHYKLDVAGGGILLFDKASRHISKNPRTVLYLENLDQAFGELHSMLHQILDDREIMNYGRRVDFNDVVVVGGSVIDEDYLNRYIDMGYDVDKIKDHFYKDINPQNLINRFENKLIIKPVSSEDLEKLISNNVGKANRVLKPHGIKVAVDKSVRDHLIISAELNKIGVSGLERLTQFALESAVKSRKNNEVSVGTKDVEVALKALKKDLARSSH